MNTPTHIAIAAMSLGKKAQYQLMPALVLGAIFPDILMFIFFFVDLIRGFEPQTIFDVHYFTPQWQIPLNITNSIPIFTLITVVAYVKKWRWLLFFAIAALLHMITDLPVHREDAHAHFYPLTTWKFISPVSYWDFDYYGNVVLPFEIAFLSYAALQGGKYFETTFGKWFYRLVMIFIPIIAAGGMAYSFLS